MAKKKPRMVCVEWDDAWSDTEQVTADSDFYEQPYSLYEVGFLKSTRRGRVVVCLQWAPGMKDEEPTFRRCVSVPRGMVRRITYLEEAH